MLIRLPKWVDEQNKVCNASDKDKITKAYAVRLEKILANVPAELLKQYNLDIKAYYVTDINAFASPKVLYTYFHL